MIRQGDLLFVHCERVPTDAKRIPDGIIARGQATTHTHRLVGEGAELLADGPNMFIRAERPATIAHEEHGAVDLPAGNYQITRQREYEPAGWRQVAD